MSFSPIKFTEDQGEKPKTQVNMASPKIFSFIELVINGKKNVFLLKPILAVLSLAFLSAVKLKNTLYRFRILKPQKAPIRVVSIGNIVCGGTGKTPFTLFLAKQLKDKKIGILSRGYQSSSEKKNILFSKEGSALEMGDEAKLLARRLTNVPIWIGRDRYRSALDAHHQGVQIALLDDGFQHRKFARDLDIVLMDARDPFGKGHFLPRGYLREEPSRLKEADFIVLNHVSEEKQLSQLKEKLRKYTSSPILSMKYKVGSIRDLQGEDQSINRGSKVGIFSGIAKPESFEHTITEIGFRTLEHFQQSDHSCFNLQELNRYSDSIKKKEGKCLICTEKDAVKLSQTLSLSLPIYYLEMEIQPLSPTEEWEMLIETIVSLCHNDPF